MDGVLEIFNGTGRVVDLAGAASKRKRAMGTEVPKGGFGVELFDSALEFGSIKANFLVLLWAEPRKADAVDLDLGMEFALDGADEQGFDGRNKGSDGGQ